MNCPNCSHELAERTKFCVRCGWAKVAGGDESGGAKRQDVKSLGFVAHRESIEQSSKRWWPKVVALFALLVMVLCVATWYAMKSANPFKESALSRPGGDSSAILSNDAGVAEDVNRAISAQNQEPEMSGNPATPVVNEAVPEVLHNSAVPDSENDVTEIAPQTQKNGEVINPRISNSPEVQQTDRSAIY
ncbi:MAG TPA: hypothetical protein VIG85_07495 [Comamonas sp.]